MSPGSSGLQHTHSYAAIGGWQVFGRIRTSPYLVLAAAIAAAVAAAVVAQSILADLRSVTAPATQPVVAQPYGHPTAEPPADVAGILQQFDTDRAMEHIRLLSEQIGTRPGGSEAEEEATEYIAATFREYGYSVYRQSDIPIRETGRTTQNVHAVRHADAEKNDGRCVLVGAHYDSIGRGHRSPGANDNGTGVAVMLEVARVVAELPLPYRLQLVAFGAEERQGPTFDHHHYGSRAALQRYAAGPQSSRLEAVISVDMVGVGDTLYVRNMNVADGWLVRHFQHSGRRLGLELPYKEDPRGCSDHEPFELYGIPSIWLERLPDSDYHSPRDRFENISPTHVQTAGRLGLHALLTMDPEQLD